MHWALWFYKRIQALLNLTQKLKLLAYEVQLYILGFDKALPDWLQVAGQKEMAVSLRAFVDIRLCHFLAFVLPRLFFHSFFNLCTVLIRSFPDGQFPSGHDNIWRLVGAKEGTSAESHKNRSISLSNSGRSSLQMKLGAAVSVAASVVPIVLLDSDAT